jgi:hypothetical protein
MDDTKLTYYFRRESTDMNTNNYIAISLAAMSAGAALSAAVICFFTNNPQPVVAMGIIGISCVLSAASTVVVAFGSKAQGERNDKRVTDTNSWFSDWMRQHEHEHELEKINRDRADSDSNTAASRRMDAIEANAIKMEEKLNNMTIFLDRTFAANSEQR